MEDDELWKMPDVMYSPSSLAGERSPWSQRELSFIMELEINKSDEANFKHADLWLSSKVLRLRVRSYLFLPQYRVRN